MKATIDLSLPKEQLDLLREIYAQQKILIDHANATAWLDDDAMCMRFGIGKTTLRRWRDEEDLPFSQIADKRFYAPKLVDEWMMGYSPQNILVISSKLNKQQLAS